eukprot:Nk52_evm1s2360 gene=Nk52_evmTU1s2360
MNPKCARCDKTVYPVEKLNILDKAWHKGCFNCETCHMTLTMKTYQALDKKPYCKTHYPKLQHTQVADTPEGRRLAENSANFSQVKYHADYETTKGQVTEVTDTPEYRTATANTSVQSAAKYSGHVSSNSSTPAKSSYTPPADAPRQAAIPHFHREPEPAEEEEEEPAPAADSYADQYEDDYNTTAQDNYEQEEAASPSAGGGDAGPVYVAMYDYDAGDSDEVTFVEGDRIYNVEIIDDGWMQGTVERTGESGMLPSNYVEL